MPNIPIFLSSDNNYAPFVATTIASVCDNTKSFCEFYVIDGGINQDNRSKIMALSEQFKNFSIEFITIDYDKYFKNFREITYLGLSTYSRFLIPELKPEKTKCIYLDVDIIVIDDIKKLFDINLDNYVIGAVRDTGNSKYLNYVKQSIGLPANSIYFNAGVLLINNSKWVVQNITQKLFDVEQKYREKLKIADQDILNICFQNSYKLLDIKYNTMYDNPEIIIRHFTNYPKVWQADFYLDFETKQPKKIEHADIFWKYAKMTPFYQEICDIKNKFLASNLLYNRFNKLVNKGN